MRRFYCPDADPAQDALTLGADESAHIRNVLRLREGERIAVFDGRGNEYLCEVESVGKRETELAVISRTEPPSKESPLDLTLAAALLKHDKFDMVVQKAVELGVTRLLPIVTKRCDIPPDAAGKRLERWERIAIEASKQCGRATLMEISDVGEFADHIGEAGSEAIVFVEQGGRGFPAGIGSSRITAFVGPEGGWEEAEIAMAEKADAALVTLGGRILRAETAAIAVTALLQHRYGDLK